ncbi:hypothetical protein KP509_13G040500 [Ceratopteris richardii]|uniref:Uncharacterized protein n=1 Tax=Ceratopteris richardii TaxID=49495 RepID=A0A8T2TEZ4_CERRI|nr:hypothetical protein KP509_13G040500 [Ceratopteris richardii]KAH7421101.1 hypothetical protein KP509_13G040500 [Ceratopteris richardii]
MLGRLAVRLLLVVCVYEYLCQREMREFLCSMDVAARGQTLAVKYGVPGSSKLGSSFQQRQQSLSRSRDSRLRIQINSASYYHHAKKSTLVARASSNSEKDDLSVDSADSEASTLTGVLIDFSRRDNVMEAVKFSNRS